jgi:hypothetical protein
MNSSKRNGILMRMNNQITTIFNLSSHVRYVTIYANGHISVCVALEGDPIQIATQLEQITGGQS